MNSFKKVYLSLSFNITLEKSCVFSCHLIVILIS